MWLNCTNDAGTRIKKYCFEKKTKKIQEKYKLFPKKTINLAQNLV